MGFKGGPSSPRQTMSNSASVCGLIHFASVVLVLSLCINCGRALHSRCSSRKDSFSVHGNWMSFFLCADDFFVCVWIVEGLLQNGNGITIVLTLELSSVLFLFCETWLVVLLLLPPWLVLQVCTCTAPTSFGPLMNGEHFIVVIYMSFWTICDMI